ncbi:AAA family ATPase [Candidatus Peregrinibacteria bacterium RIFCSPLOWO2_02_FULL_39_10]|nr:MAG: AAA family ATPase [Candidatus Peregrinibacteria bacterium RIFCSPLOWO2_02_FULL_39_10]
MFKRLQKFKYLGKESGFLWGPRQTGKSTLLKNLFPDAPYYDLLLANEFQRLIRNPSLIKEELMAMKFKKGPVIIDEVQKVPALLDEIQWLIVNKKIPFILCGSSARKLKRTGANLLGGRALRYELFPLVSKEIPNFDLIRALNNGLLPRHYLADNAKKMIEAYIGDYLKEEIAAEALTRNVPAFARFLEVAAFSNGEVVNYNNIAQECGISAVTVKEYFQILFDTLVGFSVPSYRKKPKRRIIQAPKFYFFDIGIANFLLKRGEITPGSEIFGRVFEHLIFQEILAHSHYSGHNYPISYWRTSSGLEVDFILGEHKVALEVKGVPEVQSHHLKGLKAFYDEYKPQKTIIVSLDKKPRIANGISIFPVKDFLVQLWADKII